MNDEELFRDKLRKIEALFAGAATPGERAAAGAAAERLREKLKTSELKEATVEVRYALPDPWARKLFVALARRYGLKPYRYRRMHRQTVVVKAPRTFLEDVLWPQFQQLWPELSRYLDQVTTRVISEEVFGNTADAEEVAEPPKLAT